MFGQFYGSFSNVVLLDIDNINLDHNYYPITLIMFAIENAGFRFSLEQSPLAVMILMSNPC